MLPELDAIKRLLLHEWDPIGVSGASGAEDEYDRYAMRIFTMIASGAQAGEIALYLNQVMTERMELAGNPTLERQVAERVVAIHVGHSRILGQINMI